MLASGDKSISENALAAKSAREIEESVLNVNRTRGDDDRIAAVSFEETEPRQDGTENESEGLAHRVGAMKRDAPSSHAHSGTALTRYVSRGATRTTVSIHSTYAQNRSSYDGHGRGARNENRGVFLATIFDFREAHNINYDSVSQQGPSGISDTLIMNRSTSFGFQVHLLPSSSSLNVNSYGQRWYCACFTFHTSSIPCRYKAWIALCRLCPLTLFLRWNC
jgi:hypothetical protein